MTETSRTPIEGEVVGRTSHEQNATNAILALAQLLDALEGLDDPTYLGVTPEAWTINRYLPGQPDGVEFHRKFMEAYERAWPALADADDWL